MPEMGGSKKAGARFCVPVESSFRRWDLELRALPKARLAVPYHSNVCDLHTAAGPLAALLLGKELWLGPTTQHALMCQCVSGRPLPLVPLNDFLQPVIRPFNGSH